MSAASKELQFYYTVGISAIIIILGGIGGWAAWASINGAVIASSTVVVEHNSKKVQHADGGIISDIYVRDGQSVKAGELLLRLDKTETRANLSIINGHLMDLLARQARLEAERDASGKVEFPILLTSNLQEKDIKRILNGQRRLFQARMKTRNGKKAQLKQRILQLEEEISGLKAQKKSKEEQVKLISEELDAVNILREKELVPVNRVLALKREKVRLEGQRGEHIAAIARAKGQIGEITLRSLQIDQDMQTEVLSDLRDTQAKIIELSEKKVAALAKLKRTEIRAPKDGVVHQLNVHTIGGVITSSEPVMLIVPQGDTLILEANVYPQNIDQIKLSQNARIRFSAFDSRTTPELNGVVAQISADLSYPKDNSAPYYTVRLKIPKAELVRFGNRKLKPGMPAEVFIQTGSRTAFSYLLKPLSDQIMRAFRER